jgi:hypothetical protein
MTITQIEEKIKELQKQKIQIQKNCDHKERNVKFLEDRNVVKVFCSNCNKDLGYPNQSDLNNFFKKSFK